MTSHFNFSNAIGQITLSTFESKVRSTVPYFVYLPPDWNSNSNYRLILFLHGQGGDEGTFKKYVASQQLNEWILTGKIPNIVIAGIRGDDNKDDIQWFTKANEALLSPNGEFIQFCRDHFKAGGEKEGVSIEGHSRGGGGALYYMLKYPSAYTSTVSMGYVSDYTLKSNKEIAIINREALIESQTKLYIEIGTEDQFVRDKNRKASFMMHDFLTSIKIPHTFNHLFGVEHGFGSFWNHYSEEGMHNGLLHLKRHCEGL